MHSETHLDCPAMRALVGLLGRPARSAREFMSMCGTTADHARRTREHLKSLNLVSIQTRQRGRVTVKLVELTPLGVEVARLYQRAEELIAQHKPSPR
jgi:hypothetical protein